MQVRKLDASAGWRWVLGGFRLLATRPLPLLALIVFYLFMLIMPSGLPFIGAIIPTLLTPIFAVGLMTAMRCADEGGTPHPRMLFAAFAPQAQQAWRRLLLLGLVTAAATMLAFALTSLLDDGALLEITGTPAIDTPAADKPAADSQQDSFEVATTDTKFGLTRSLLVFLVLLIPVQAAAWYAPLFVAWHNMPVGQSLFFSFVAVWRNKSAFALYLLAWLTVALTASSLVQMLRSGLSGAASLLSVLLFASAIAMLVAMYGSIWLSYRDAISGDPAPPAS